MIRDTLLNGILDAEIRRQVLGIKDILTSSINDLIALVESREMARNAAPPPDVATICEFKRHHLIGQN